LSLITKTRNWGLDAFTMVDQFPSHNFNSILLDSYGNHITNASFLLHSGVVDLESLKFKRERGQDIMKMKIIFHAYPHVL